MSVSYLTQQPFVSSAPVPQIDLNLMATVLQQKQSQFDANFSKMQTQLSSVASLDMVRDVDRQYRDSKLNEMTKNLNSMGGIDFSDPNISSQIDGTVSSLFSDGRIVNSVASTKNMRALAEGYKKMQTDPKLMKYFSDANYDADMEEVNRYANSKDIDDSYRGKSSPTLFASYMPDLTKAAQKIKADGWQTLSDGTTGFYNINSGEVVTPEKISNDIMGLLDSNQRAQLARDANYLWGKKLGLKPEELVGKITNSTQQKIRSTEESIQILEGSLKTASIDDTKILNKRIGDYKQQLTTLRSRKINIEKDYNNYLKNGGSLEGLRFMAYEDDLAKTLGNLFSYSKTKEEKKTNPYYVEKYKSELRVGELAVAQGYKLEQIREAAKYKDGASNPYNQPLPPLANPDYTDLNTKDQAKFNNQLASQFELIIKGTETTNPEFKGYKAALSALADGKPAVVPKDADNAVLSQSIYEFGALRLRKANTAANVEAVWKEQNSLPVLEEKVDKTALANIKAKILQDNPTYKSVDNIRFNNIGISKVQYRKDKDGNLIEDNDFYVEVEVKTGKEYVKAKDVKISAEYAKILSQGRLYPESREQMIINRGVDETNHFSTVVQSKINPKTAFKLTIAKVDGAYEGYIEVEGKAVPMSALDVNIPKSEFAWTSLQQSREYLKNIPNKEALLAKLKNYTPSATDKNPNISFDNNNFYSSNFSWKNVVNTDPALLKQAIKESNQNFNNNSSKSSISKLPKFN